MSVRVEQLVVDNLREWLLLQLPAKVDEVNADRAPVLRAAYAGPYTITSGMKLYPSTTDPASGTETTLTTGTRTAAQVVSDIEGVVAGIASADSDGRLLLTGSAPVIGQAAKLIAIADDQGNGANAVFGWNPGGNVVVREPLVAPGYSGICDGWPSSLNLGQGFWLVMGDRESVAVQPDVRRDEHIVAVELVLMQRQTSSQAQRDREAIESCLRCVREVLLTSEGRRLGVGSDGKIMKLEESKARIPGKPFSFQQPNTANPLFDVAMFEVAVRVFERPE